MITQILHCGDNLEYMKTLNSNSIDLIYNDLLYGTGRKFADYQDLKPIRSEIENHYIPRIKEMHRVLKSTGSIYLHCDWHINHWIRCILDDVFGYENFQNEIIWHYKNSALKAKSNKFRQNTDNIYYYAKNKGKHTWNDIFEKCEPYKASKHKFNSVTKKAERLRNENGKIDYFFVDEIKQDNLFQINALNSAENTKYDTQKPKALIEKFIKASSNEGDLVADFYLGSGTTCEVALELGRKFIGCDINPRAVELSKKRCGIFS